MSPIKILTGALATTLLLIALLWATPQPVAAQGIPSVNDLLNRVSSTEEKIANRLPVGPYYVTVEGERFVDSGFFRLDVTSPQGLPTDQLDVSVALTPTGDEDEASLADAGEADAASADSASAAAEPIAQTFEAPYENGEYFIGALPFDESERWLVEIQIADSGGLYRGEFTTWIWPRSPEPPLLFVIGSIAVPIGLAVGAIALFAARGVRLMEPRREEAVNS